VTALAGEPRGAESIGDEGRRVAHQQRALRRQRQLLDQPPRPDLEIAAVAELGVDVGEPGVEATVGAARLGELGDQNRQGLGLAADGAQDVEGDDVARDFPDRARPRLLKCPGL